MFFRLALCHAVLWEKLLKYSRCFVPKFPHNLMPLCLKISIKISLVAKFPLMIAFWKFFTNICFVVIFPQKNLFFVKFSQKLIWLKNFYKNSLCWKISTKNRLVGMFAQKLVLFENLHKNLICCWISTNIRSAKFFWKKIALLENLNKYLLCWKISTKNCFVKNVPK